MIIHKPSLGSRLTGDPTKNLGPIGSAVLTFIRYKQTDKHHNRHPNKQTDTQAKFIYKFGLYVRMSVCVQQMSKCLNQSGPIFFVTTHKTPGKVYQLTKKKNVGRKKCRHFFFKCTNLNRNSFYFIKVYLMMRDIGTFVWSSF